jgi:hypothetical protein
MIKEVPLIDAGIKAREAASESRPAVKVIAGSQHLAPRFDNRALKKQGKGRKTLNNSFLLPRRYTPAEVSE